MAPTRKEGCLKRAGDTDWRPYVVAEAGNWWKAAEGVWLPQSYREDQYGIPADAPSYLIRTAIVSIRYSDINEDYSDTVFRLKIPKGVWVNDMARGTKYKTGMVNDRTIERDARKAEELRTAYEAARAAPPIPEISQAGWARTAAIAVLPAFLVATAAIGYTFWRWRRGSGLPARR